MSNDRQTKQAAIEKLLSPLFGKVEYEYTKAISSYIESLQSEKNAMPHMCRDGHDEICRKDSEHELCPLCRVIAERDAYKSDAEALYDLISDARAGFIDAEALSMGTLGIAAKMNESMPAVQQFREDCGAMKKKIDDTVSSLSQNYE